MAYKGTTRDPEQIKRDVLDEIRRRAAAGHRLSSGANRGDWLYAGACRFFGSWGKAVEAAGIDYQSVKQAGLSKTELLARIRAAAAAGPLIAGEHKLLSSNALRLFGSWKGAVRAAGCEDALPQKLWNKDRVIEAITIDLAKGLPVNTLAVIARNEPLYGAARREFGSWVKALRAVDPSLINPRWKRGESIIRRAVIPAQADLPIQETSLSEHPVSSWPAAQETTRLREMSHQVFELDVRLREIEPPIWRTIEVPGTASLEDVHLAIQVAMGWTNSHLHQFNIGDAHYGMVDVDGADDLELVDEREHRLQDLVKSGASFVYEYDFGDGWEHDVTVKKISAAAKAPRPRCVAGARACPPEDCGGPGGYERLLAALADPRHHEHESMVSWSNNFKPEQFVLPKAGLELRGEIERLRALAAGDDQDDLELDGGPLADLPTPLVQAVLSLPPLARASLSALIAGSLADEIEHARAIIDQLASSKRKQKPARHGRAQRGGF